MIMSSPYHPGLNPGLIYINESLATGFTGARISRAADFEISAMIRCYICSTIEVEGTGGTGMFQDEAVASL